MKKLDTLNSILKEYNSGNKKKAYKKFKNIFELNKKNLQLRYNLAVMEQELGLYDEAEINYKFLIKNGSNIKAKINLYNIYLKKNFILKALDLVNSILITSPKLDNIIQDRVFILFKLKKYDLAIEECKKIINKKKENAYILNTLAWSYYHINKIDKAELIFLEILKKDNKDIQILNSLGRFYHELRNSEKSREYFTQAMSIDSNIFETLNNFAGFCLEESEYENALKLYKKAEKINPNHSILLNNISKAYFTMGEINIAKKYCKRAIILDSNNEDIRKNLSLIYIKNFNFKKGWDYFDSRLGLSDFIAKNNTLDIVRDKIPKNNKIDKKSKILIIREQGVGDEILYGTMYHDFIKLFSNSIIECDQRLIPIFQNSFETKDSDKFVKLGSFSNYKDKVKNFDYVIYAGSLGKFVRNELKDFPKNPYLKKINNIKNTELATIIKKQKKTKIGISWKSFKNRYAKEKSLELLDFEKLFQDSNSIIFNLQYGETKIEIENFIKKYGYDIITLKSIDLFNDITGLTNLLTNLDLFITVSNSTAHLAGALGIKTFLIKPDNHASYHYWNYDNGKTPWYPTVEIITKNDLINNNFIQEKFI